MQKNNLTIGELGKNRFKSFALALIFANLSVSPFVFAATKRLQICSASCVSQACKKLAQDVEFEFEMAEDFLLPRCSKNALPKKEFRLSIFEDAAATQITVELGCDGKHQCLSQVYPVLSKSGVLVAKVVNDVKLAIKHNKTIAEVVAKEQKLPPPPPPAPPLAKMPSEEEWDRVILVSPVEKKPEANVAADLPEVKEALPVLVAKETVGSATMSLGAENWSYSFESDTGREVIPAINSRIYPKLVFTAIYWPLPYLRTSSQLGASMLTFRLKANQPIDGDGQLVFAHKYQADLIVGYMKALGDFVHLGVESGYEFSGSTIDQQRIGEKVVTIVPGFLSHALRIGPRLIIGEKSNKGVIDVGVGFYPFFYYAESPDEPTTHSSAFAWSAQGRVRVRVGADIFADGTMNAQSLYVNYDQEPQRENVQGEKWGSGRAVSTSLSTTLGLGWVF